MPERHSTVVGGSSAARIINCPGSRDLMAKLPKIIEKDSFWSMEGTALHTLMEMLISGKVRLDNLPEEIETDGGTVYITQELIDSAVLPAMTYWNDFLMEVDDWMIEAEVDFPGIDAAFGTADILGRDDQKNITYVGDWKFGAGKGVLAAYDGVPNEQLMFYASAARNTYPDWFPAGCRVILTVIQPRARDHDMITSVEVTLADLDHFEVELRDALKHHDTNPGRWCDFQRCKTICPHHLGPLIDFAELGLSQAVAQLHEPSFGEHLAKAKGLSDFVSEFAKEVDRQMLAYMMDGGKVPGWGLQPKKKQRQWVDPAVVVPELVKMGFKDDEIWQHKLQTFQVADAAAKKRGKKIPEHLRAAPPSNEMVPVRTDEPQPSISEIMVELLPKPG